MSDHFFVVTGGPGAGKTSLITELARRGFHTIPESGRAIIREEMAIGGDALPWGNRTAYAERMLQQDLHAYSAAQALPSPVIFDRGIPDIMGYLTLCGLPVPPHVTAAAEKTLYNRRVFLAPSGMLFSKKMPSASRPAPRLKQPALSCARHILHSGTRLLSCHVRTLQIAPTLSPLIC